MTRNFAATPSIDDAIVDAGGVVPLMRNRDFPAFIFPIEAEFSNWRSEEHAWRETVALMDLSQHMTNLFIEGAGAAQLLSGLAVNSFVGFRPGIAKQFVGVNIDGYVIGDGILFYLGENSFDLVGQHSLVDWVRYNIEQSSLDVTYRLDGNALVREGDPELYRFQLQGPRALDLIGELTGTAVPSVKFFHMTEFTIAGRHVRALRHGMAGQPGFELFGPWEDGLAVREAIMNGGVRFGIQAVGARAYGSTPLEAGWIPTPVPAIFGPEMAAYRQWLPSSRVGSLGGSFQSERIEDYYLTPAELGYGRHVKFDHEFVGRGALERRAEVATRRKVTLIWNSDDVADAMRSHLQDGLPSKWIEFPKARYAYHQYDAVLVEDELVGISTDAGHLVNDSLFVSLATVEESIADGAEVEVLWGEDPVSRKPSVEPHRQCRIRAVVAPAPLSDFARTTYRGR
ncbi:aminomethyl transferase family protein [Microbacterium salsuginis]|nr:aminomethyl transferase family protein [Microbacterium sp. CFH 90308]